MKKPVYSVKPSTTFKPLHGDMPSSRHPSRHTIRSRTRSFNDGEFGPTFRVRRRRHRNKEQHHQTGRLHLLLIFLWLRTMDVVMLMSLYPNLRGAYKHYFVIFLSTMAIWTTGLLGAVVLRQNWAKYLMAISLLGSVAVVLSLIPSLPDIRQPKPELYAILGIVCVNIPAAVLLIVSKSIRKLTYLEKADEWGEFK